HQPDEHDPHPRYALNRGRVAECRPIRLSRRRTAFSGQSAGGVRAPACGQGADRRSEGGTLQRRTGRAPGAPFRRNTSTQGLLAGFLSGRADAQGQDPQAFHDALVSANKKLKAAGFRVAQPLPALLAGNRDELPPFRAARDDAVRTVKAVDEQVRALTPPDSE